MPEEHSTLADLVAKRTDNKVVNQSRPQFSAVDDDGAPSLADTNFGIALSVGAPSFADHTILHTAMSDGAPSLADTNIGTAPSVGAPSFADQNAFSSNHLEAMDRAQHDPALETIDEDAEAPASDWVANPNIQARILDADLSPEMRDFLFTFHVGQPGRPLWSYDTLGFHPSHTIADK